MILDFRRFFRKSPQEICLSYLRDQEQSLKLIFISDVHWPAKFYMDEVDPEECDLVLTLGDIDNTTMEHVLRQARSVPVYGVFGNHDGQPICGWESLDDKILLINGYKIGGISGVNEHYRNPFARSERDIAKKLRRLGPVDILISHAPPFATSRNQGLKHRGFIALDKYILKHKPQYVFHGHLHSRSRTLVYQTWVIGVVDKLVTKINAQNMSEGA